MSFYVIQPIIKNYDWAEKNRAKNICHRLCSSHEDDPIAELWVGTHNDGHAFIQSTGEFLQDFLGRPMNYLFKVLSVGRPLSIQIHPDEKRAKELHAQHPDIYPDANAKPEMAILLSETGFAFCGIRPIESIRRQVLTFFSDIFDPHIVKRWSEFDSSTEDVSDIVKDSFINIFELTSSRYEVLRNRLYRKHQTFRWLEKFFPDDRGCSICVLFLNFFSLRKYDAICVNPNVIHSYVLGNFFECMTTSNNVIRLGLTSKQKDFSAFFSTAEFSPTGTSDVIQYHGSPDPIKEYRFSPLPEIHIIDTDNGSLDISSFVNGKRYTFVFIVEGDGFIFDDNDDVKPGIFLFDAMAYPTMCVSVASRSVLVVISI
jgi:mannose-6-phosphate isomerase